MFRGAAFAACAAFFVGPVLSGAAPAAAGDWHRLHQHRAPVVQIGPHVHRVPWYHQHPWTGTGPGYYYSRHPDHIPAYPEPLTGYPVPIYGTSRPVVHAVPRYRLVVSAHVEWCAARYRSYDARTNTYQPYHGPRRQCWSPYR